jgi:hypothetical protein
MQISTPFRILLAAASLNASSSLMAQVVGFTGPYNVSNWTTSAPDGGSIDTSGAPGTVQVVGPDAGFHGNIDFTIAAASSGNISFNWSYQTSDGPAFDRASWLLNGNATYLAGDTDQTDSGSVSFHANQGDVIGLRVTSDDGLGGPGILTVSNFTAVPEPGSWALASAAPLAAFAFYRQARRMKK